MVATSLHQGVAAAAGVSAREGVAGAASPTSVEVSIMHTRLLCCHPGHSQAAPHGCVHRLVLATSLQSSKCNAVPA